MRTAKGKGNTRELVVHMVQIVLILTKLAGQTMIMIQMYIDIDKCEEERGDKYVC
jgi:hypothetical protein